MRHRSSRLKTRLIGGILVTSEALVLVMAMPLNLQEGIQQALVWVQQWGAGGAIVFMGLYILATILCIPGSLLTLGGGALFGLLWGTVYVFSAAMIGAILAFLIGRYLARGWVAKHIVNNASFAAIDQAIGQDGLKIVLLTRLSPVFPFNLLNYALGVTQVSLKDYILGTLGILPGTLLYVYIGSLAGNLAGLGAMSHLSPEAQKIQWVVRIIGLLATLAVTLYITRIARKALDQQIQNPPSHD